MSRQGGKGGAAAGKSKKAAKGGAEEKRDDVLQAVVLADSFQDRFKPFTLDKPRCLLPLVNVPLIHYTLEFLASNGVQEVFIYCGAHSEDIESFIHDSPRWSPNSIISPFSSLEFIRVSDATSIGDFLRDLDKRSLISGDFILVHGDLVANVPLDGVLARHRERKEKNRDACMTMVLRSVGSTEHRMAKARGIAPVFVVESTGRCLQYDEIHPLQNEHYLTLDPSVFSHNDFAVRSDLVDCGIDICTPEILALWSESFDYELPRKNFLHGVLKDFELNNKEIYAEIIEEHEPGYAARVSNLMMYDCICKDIADGCTVPYMPESNLGHGNSYNRTEGDNSLEDHVVVSRKSKVFHSVLGRSTTVGDGSSISGSVLGRRCKIGKNVVIQDSYLFDDVVIGDNTRVIHSVLAGSVIVGQDCYIPKGSLISYNVHIAEGKKLDASPAPRISVLTHARTLADTDVSLVGQGGKGALYQAEEEEDSDDEDGVTRDPSVLQSSLLYPTGLNLSTSSISTLASSDDDDSDFDDVDSHAGSFRAGDGGVARGRLSSFASDDSSKTDAFHSDAVNGLVDALRNDDSDDFDSAKLEFMGLRLANNASDSAMRRAVAVAFVRRAAELLLPENGGLETSKAAEQALVSKRGAIKFIKEVGIGEDSVAMQAEFVLATQKAVVAVKGLDQASGRQGALLAALLQQLYNLDVLEEDGILAWWADNRASESESLTRVKEKCRVLVEWLENADEEESDEDDDEEEDSD